MENSCACVFIDSSNPEIPNQIMNHSSHPFVKPPFPPLIDPKDLLIISKDNKPSRSPNAFIIYRKVFLKTTRDQGYFLPMTIVSSMASKSWDQEPDEIRDYYKKLAKEAYKYRSEKFPKKVKRRRKKEPWNANIAFQNDLRNTFFDNSNSTKNSPSPPMEPYLDASSYSSKNVDFPSQNSSPNLENLEQINETSLFNENFHGLFSSPNLSNNSSISSSPNMSEFTIMNNNNNLNNNHFEIPNAEFDLYNKGLPNYLLLNQNNFSFNDNLNDFSNTPNQIDYSNYFDYNTTDLNTDPLLYSTGLLQYQLNPIGVDTFSYL